MKASSKCCEFLVTRKDVDLCISLLPVYVIKREYETEEEGGTGRRFAVLGPKKVTGVGPTTNDGVPTTLKSVCGYCISHTTTHCLTHCCCT